MFKPLHIPTEKCYGWHLRLNDFIPATFFPSGFKVELHKNNLIIIYNIIALPTNMYMYQSNY